MSINIGDNFSYLGKKFLDSRQSFDTKANMNACTDVPIGFITYCVEDGKRYEYKEGGWIEYVTNSGGESESVDLTGYATKDYVDEAIDNIDIPEVDLTGYLTESDLFDYVKLEYFLNYLLPYAKKTDIRKEYATKEELQAALGDVEDLLGGI